MTRRFWTVTIEIDEPREVNVYLYDTVEEMRAAAMEFATEVGEKVEEGHYDYALGVTHGYWRYRDEDLLPEVVTMRLVRGHLLPEIISHEVAHAAQHLYLVDHLDGGDSEDLAVDHFASDNETFAYIFGALFGAIWTMLEEER